MDLVTPDIGLLVWTTVVLLLLLFLLKKFAWKPILSAVKEREESIEAALSSADRAREEMTKLQSDNDKIMKQALKEKDALLKEARELKDKIMNNAKINANEEANKIIDKARLSIESEKQAAITELKNQVAVLSVEIAEKILKKELANDKDQKELVENMLKDTNLN